MAPMFENSVAFFGLYIYVKSLKTVPSGEAVIEIIVTRPLTIYNSSVSKAKPLRSPRLVSLNSFNFDQWQEKVMHA